LKAVVHDIFETKRMVNNWDEFTGTFRATIKVEPPLPTRAGIDIAYPVYDLPGRGGRITRAAAKAIATEIESGIWPADIRGFVGC